MRDERGFTPSTADQWSRTIRRFLRLRGAGQRLGDLTEGDIDNYVAIQGKGRWTRVSTANQISALHALLPYAAKAGARTDWQSRFLGLVSISTRRCHMPPIGLPFSKCWPTSTPKGRGTSATAPYFCCSRSMACRAAKLLLCV
jgi:hypothetical protein